MRGHTWKLRTWVMTRVCVCVCIAPIHTRPPGAAALRHQPVRPSVHAALHVQPGKGASVRTPEDEASWYTKGHVATAGTPPYHRAAASVPGWAGLGWAHTWSESRRTALTPLWPLKDLCPLTSPALRIPPYSNAHVALVLPSSPTSLSAGWPFSCCRRRRRSTAAARATETSSPRTCCELRVHS